MPFKSVVATVSFLAIFLCENARSEAPANLTPEQTEEVQQLIRQLGGRNFGAREKAMQKLRDYGKAVVPLLEQASKMSDLEVSRRCEQLLALAKRSPTEEALAQWMEEKSDAKLLKLPSWARFSKILGDDANAKKLFVDMYCADHEMLAQQDKDAAAFGAKFAGYIQSIQQNLYTPFGRANPIPHHQVVALLFMATDQHVSKDQQSFYMMNSLFYQPAVQEGFKSNPGSRKLLMSFLEQRANANTVQQIFYIAKNLNLREAVPMALKTVNDKAVPVYTRGMALLFMGQMKATDHSKDIEKLLTDTTQMGNVRTGTVTINAQMRDVALASLILMSNQNINEYDFPYLKQFQGYRPELNLPPYYYGFADDKQREVAFKRWKDSQEVKKK